MKLFLTDQRHRMPQHLEELKKVPVRPYRPERLRERNDVVHLGTSDAVFERAVEECMTYRIFPPGIMHHLAEWTHHGRAMRVGAGEEELSSSSGQRSAVRSDF